MGHADIRVQEPIHLSASSEPEPDIAVVKINSSDYVDHHPTPEEVFLMIEVADATLNYDRKKKAALYSKSKIADYWVIDVVNERVFVFSEPLNETYQRTTVLSNNAILSIAAFPKMVIFLSQFFPVR